MGARMGDLLIRNVVDAYSGRILDFDLSASRLFGKVVGLRRVPGA